jgi:hypothetical protein
LAFHLVEILTFFLVTQIFSFLATPVSSGFYPLVSVSQAIACTQPPTYGENRTRCKVM